MGRADKHPDDMNLAELNYRIAMLSSPADLDLWAVERATQCQVKLEEDAAKYPWIAADQGGHRGRHGRGCFCDEFDREERAEIEEIWARYGMHGFGAKAKGAVRQAPSPKRRSN